MLPTRQLVKGIGMPRFLDTMRKAVPSPARKLLRHTALRLRNTPFQPYLKRKNIEGVVFDFWIGDREGRQWYDLQCTDPDWLEMRFIRDHILSQGDVVFECGG